MSHSYLDEDAKGANVVDAIVGTLLGGACSFIDGDKLDNFGDISSFLGLSASIYFGLGFSVSVGLNFLDLMDELRGIWK